MKRWVLCLSILTLASLALQAHAQLSPGKLAKAHANLEGISNCTKCHELAKAIDGARCLDCHSTLAARIKAKKGFHSQKKVQDKSCIACHSDHHGRDFKMIRWEKGEESFDHAETGWKLEGRHSELKCKECHRPELLHPAIAKARDLNSRTTRLGLDKACLSCHRDEHQGQMDKDCSTCHSTQEWKKTRFDHQKAHFTLGGKHANVACVKCHKAELPRAAVKSFVVEDPAKGLATRYQPLSFSRCTDCHTDPHQGRLGQDCAQCHSTEGFQGRDTAFDHTKTRYPLTGAHQSVECAQCHKGQGAARQRPAYKNCTPCHQDPHEGQLTRPASGRDCASCHDTRRFQPSLFGQARHNEGKAKLEGAHQAVACLDCHTRPAPKAALRFDLGGKAFSGQSCVDCHGDAHMNQATPWMDDKGCLSCHSVAAWKARDFDHNRTQWKLEGKHQEQGCAKCHKVTEQRTVPLKGMGSACVDCHKDEHQGQFREEGISQVDCARCHSPKAWKETSFNHDSSRFPLDGRHKDVACVECHAREARPDGTGDFIRYKALGIRCEDCHGEQRTPTGD